MSVFVGCIIFFVFKLFNIEKNILIIILKLATYLILYIGISYFINSNALNIYIDILKNIRKKIYEKY